MTDSPFLGNLTMARLRLAAFAGLFLGVGTVAAQTSFPMITHLHPVAVQRGQTAKVEVFGVQNFYGTKEVLFDRPGFTAEIVPVKTAKAEPPAVPVVRSVPLKLTATDKAAAGVHEFRLFTQLGVSSVGQVVVVDDPVVEEKNPNNIRTQAQVLALPCVVAGKLEAVEDVDWFKFEAKAGETLSFEMFCARIQDKIHDLQKHAKPMLTLQDDEGRELAGNDHFFFADPLLTYTVPKTGTYYLQIRESTYDGDPRWVYALVATRRPYASHVYPLAGKAGNKVEVEPIGSAAKVQPRVPVQFPAEVGVHEVQLEIGKERTNPVTVISSTLDQHLETEPNDDPEKATPVTVPGGINGRIQERRDLDHFRFTAKKGKALRFDLQARRFGTLLNSSLHGVLEIMNQKGVILAANDATHGPEASLTFTPAADGEYVLRVRDLNSKGGPSFVYNVEADFARPDFTVRCDPDKAMIGPGSATAWFVHVVRTGGFAGPVQVEVKGLPPDVTASPLTIPPTMTQGVIVVEAAPQAEARAAAVEVFATGKVKNDAGQEETLVRRAQSNQEIYFPGGGRGKFDVDMRTVGVTDPSDILKVNVSTKEITLKPGQEVKIDVDVLRRSDYDKAITLDIILRHLNSVIGDPLPPGVKIVAGKSKTLLGTGSKGWITLKADGNAAPIERVPISVLCHVSINFVVKVTYSSPPIWVSVGKK